MKNANKENWARDISKGLVSFEQLARHNIVDEKLLHEFEEVKNNLDIRVPKAFLEDIQKNNAALKKQFIPSSNELIFLPEELEDPIGDEIWTPVEGITH